MEYILQNLKKAIIIENVRKYLDLTKKKDLGFLIQYVLFDLFFLKICQTVNIWSFTYLTLPAWTCDLSLLQALKGAFPFLSSLNSFRFLWLAFVPLMLHSLLTQSNRVIKIFSHFGFLSFYLTFLSFFSGNFLAVFSHLGLLHKLHC